MKIPIKNIRNFILLILLTGTAFSGFLTLTGCSNDEQKSPCPHFGLFCTKTPINSWSSNDHA